MKKTLTANISGLVFHIDEDAYEKLNRYLDHVRRHFTQDEGRDEILSDIESRIAEMLQDRTSASKQVITLKDIEQVIGQLGEPGQIRGEESAEEPAVATGSWERTQRRLYRDPDNKYLGGVAGGLGAFFNVDPTWIRVAFIVFTFFYGFGPLVYIILWIVVPKARTTAEKLEMRGEKVNISNIHRSIQEELHDIKKNIRDLSDETREDLKKKGNRSSLENGLESVGMAFGAFFRVVFRIIAILIGVAFIFVGIFLLIGLIFSLFLGHVPVNLPFGPWQIYSIHSFFAMIFASSWMINLAIVGILLVLGIPLIAFIYAGLRLVFGFESRIRYFGLVTFLLWIIGLALTVFVGLNTARNFSVEQHLAEETVLQTSAWPNLYLELNPEMQAENLEIRDSYRWGGWHMVHFTQGQQGQGLPRLRIRPSRSDQAKMIITRESRGSTSLEARDLARSIQYDFLQKDSLIYFDPVYSFDTRDGWRAQRVYIELLVPDDRIVVLDPDLEKVMDVRWGSHPRVIRQNRQRNNN